MFNFGCKKSDERKECAFSSIKTKKQQAIADREVELILLAKGIVQKEGFANLTMDKLTAASSYSKGTIYNHFCSKEDVVLALCIHSLKNEAMFLTAQPLLKGRRGKK